MQRAVIVALDLALALCWGASCLGRWVCCLLHRCGPYFVQLFVDPVPMRCKETYCLYDFLFRACLAKFARPRQRAGRPYGDS